MEEKIEEKPKEEVKITELEKVCGPDKEIYEALYQTMFLDPRKIGTSIQEAYNLTRAAVWDKIAGG